MAERWTDDRIDDLRNEVEKQGNRTDAALHDVRSEVRDLRKDMDVRFDQVGVRLDSMLYALIGLGGAMLAAMASLIAALIVTQL